MKNLKLIIYASSNWSITRYIFVDLLPFSKGNDNPIRLKVFTYRASLEHILHKSSSLDLLSRRIYKKAFLTKCCKMSPKKLPQQCINKVHSISLHIQGIPARLAMGLYHGYGNEFSHPQLHKARTVCKTQQNQSRIYNVSQYNFFITITSF